MTTTLDRPVDSEISNDDAQSKIARVLARLDRNEKLTRRTLKHGDRFCILGLFADESGLGKWGRIDKIRVSGYRDISYYKIGERMGSSQLDKDLVQYYRMYNANGHLDISRVPAELMRFLYDIKSDYNLASINDTMLGQGFSNAETTYVLAKIIRTGAVFLED